MRYPGPNRQERQLRRLLFVGSFMLFFIGLGGVSLKYRPIQPATPTFAAVTLPTASPTASFGVTLLMLDGVTGKPLANQAIAIIPTADCPANTSCPTTSPLVMTTTAGGRIIVDQQIIKKRPKLYATNYRMETYFTFTDSERPNELTLFKPTEGTKTLYDISQEEIPIGLTPAVTESPAL